ncbi:H+/oligopeptide symporter [Handroanthus impetiginosus]|uniref:H+/oligopeptide symporter n=1 Tax=Handroanthus impetiginosus TaxID=429701 RepID=A0A2G9G5N7_9LAMI|nr:H+/oligopeptide symporter [Handroanthus impetiginosus]
MCPNHELLRERERERERGQRENKKVMSQVSGLYIQRFPIAYILDLSHFPSSHTPHSLQTSEKSHQISLGLSNLANMPSQFPPMGEDPEPGCNITPSPLRTKARGGFKAVSFIYALVALENMGLVANMVSLVLYFSYKMYFDLSSAANTLTNLMGSTFLLSIIGGFISDTFINRFLTCVIFGTLEVSALSMMTIQAHSDSLLPKPCGKSSCVEGAVAVYFYTALCLFALGVGGVRGALPALGADQFDPKDPKEAKGLGSYFNWLLLSTVTGSSIGVTVVVWVATNKNNHNWWKGFLITAVGSFVGFVFLVLGKPFYRLQVPRDSPLIRIAQVIVVAIKNRGLSHPESPNELYEINEKDSESTAPKIAHTPQFRWLDKAAILPQNTEPSPWKVCTVTQVEEVKVLTRMLPFIASTIIVNTCMAQLQTFSVQQGYRMDPHLGSFQVPAASIPVIPLLFMIILIPIYDRLFVPFIRKFTNHPSGVTQLQRVGVGLVLSALSMSIAALVEVKRRNQSLKNPLKPISLFWLAFQYGIFGIADMFTLVGLLEFYYKEAPAGMKSLSTSFTWISISFGYFLSSIFVDAINAVTKRITPSKQGWLHGQDLDRNNLNLFYWFLAILSGLNFLNYLFWATWYKYKNDDENGVVSSSASPGPQSTSDMPFLKAAATEEEMSKTRNGGSVVEETNGKE